MELWPVIRRILAHCGLQAKLRRLPIAAALTIGRFLELRALIKGGEPLLTRYTVSILARHQTYDISAAQQYLGYAPVVPFEQGIEACLAALEITDTTGPVS